MKTKVAVGLGLLMWQVIAGIVAFSGQTEMILSYWPDPAWFAMIAGLLLSPPAWVAAAVLVVAGGLIAWGCYVRPSPVDAQSVPESNINPRHL